MNRILYIYVCVATFLFSGCSTNDIDTSTDINTPTDEGSASTSSYNTPIIEWGISKHSVKQKMQDYKSVYEDDNTLIYEGIADEAIISYSFSGDKLQASLLYIEASKISLSELTKVFKTYEKADDKYGGYINNTTTTYGSITISGMYYCVGWAIYVINNGGSDNGNVDDDEPIEDDANLPQPNEIWYTSADGNIVEPYNCSEWDVTVVSNTYTDGKGVITVNADITNIYEYAFKNCTTLTSISIPKTVESIGKCAFWCCSKLSDVTLPYGVVQIGAAAFYNCDALCDIIIPNSVQNIGNQAFMDCYRLKNVTLSKALTAISYSTFQKCACLYSITIPDGVTEIGEHAFKDSGLSSISLPSSITTISMSAFQSCGNLNNVTIPENVTYIDIDAFEGCNYLSAIYLKPVTPPAIGNTIFNYAPPHPKIYVPRGSISAYKNEADWRKYASSMQAYDF